MTSDLWSIFLNVVAAFVYAGIVWLWQNRGNRPLPNASRPQPPHVENEGPSDHRAKNRQAFEHAAHRFLFYLITFSVLYLSVTMPPLLKAQFTKSELLLSHARVIGEFLPPIPVGKNYLQITFFIIAGALYWPLLSLGETITSMLYPLIDSFYRVTYRIWSAVTMLAFFIFCIPIATTSIWAFYEKTFQDAFTTVVIILFVAFVFGQAQSERR